MYDIITFGSATMDVFVETEKELIKLNHEIHASLLSFPLGSKIAVKDIQHHSGGGGTNTAVSFANAGLKTAYVGNIGKDHNGERIIQELKENKVVFLGNKTGKTGFSVVLDAANDRTILTFKGTNDNFKITKKTFDKLKTKWFYMTSLTGKSFVYSKKIASFANKNNIKLCFNPSSYLAKKGKTYLKPILKYTNCLILNDEEAGLITKINNIEDNLKILNKLISKKGIVVITCGKNGAYAFDGKNSFFINKVAKKIQETTGAGDAFGSGFVAGLIKNKSIEYCLRAGVNNAISTIAKTGAKNGLLGKKLFSTTNKDKSEIIVKELC